MKESGEAHAVAEVEVQIRGLMVDPITNTPVVVLKDATSDAILPIWIGMYEANAIALELEKTTTPRPMTHDLLRDTVLGLGAEVRKVVVTELRDDTFFAMIWMEQGGSSVVIDARPSDALAMALRWDCPIFVRQDVLDRSRKAAGASQGGTAEQMRQWLENLNDDEMGRYKM